MKQLQNSGNWQLNFLSKKKKKKIHVKEKLAYALNYLKNFNAVRKNNLRTHSLLQNKNVDDSSTKVAETITALRLPSFIKKGVSGIKQKK